ncbi:MAG: hypothetical protein M1829_006641 [Trizodia sp. TS-e1964]|nr:MAG: hypothetical protein M1829_006641 [Trizodia sp. TS-e1964]
MERPLYAYDLPEDVLSSLQLQKDSFNIVTKDDNDAPLQRTDEGPSTSCALCGLTFENVQEQRSHVRSDFHGYNLKQRIRGQDSVSEADFEKLVEDLEESLSGSDTSDSEDEAEDGSVKKDKSNLLSSLLKKQAKISPQSGADNDSPERKKKGSSNFPLLWFKSSALPPNTSLGIYRALFTNAEQKHEAQIVEILQRKQLSPTPTRKLVPEETGGVLLPAEMWSPHFFLCMMGGGHFAGMIISLAPKLTKKPTGFDERQATVLAHKTFHRYTTRRKQGGSQSTSDAAKGAAHSAGSTLRRYNESALMNEIRDLLDDWKTLIETSQLIFVRATGSANRRTLFGPYDGQILQSRDPRIRGFPFSTRRATQAECMRAFIELTRVKFNRVDEEAIALAASATEKAQSKTDKATLPGPPKLSEEDEAALLHTTQLQALIRRSKAPAIHAYFTKNSIPPNFQFYPPNSQQNYHAPTPLHLASSTNSGAVIISLLTKCLVDPAARNLDGKTAFELAGERSSRDAFRVARHELGETRWDWAAALVPTALSKAEAESRSQREKVEAEVKESERRAVEIAKLEAEATSTTSPKSKGKAKALPVKTGAQAREEETRGMTPEMRMKLERERRARAAEERIRRMQGGGGAL